MILTISTISNISIFPSLFKSEHSEHSVKSIQFTRSTISNTFISVSLFISPTIKQFVVYGNAPISDILPSES